MSEPACSACGHSMPEHVWTNYASINPHSFVHVGPCAYADKPPNFCDCKQYVAALPVTEPA